MPGDGEEGKNMGVKRWEEGERREEDGRYKANEDRRGR